MENNNIVNDLERIIKENEVQVIESNGRTFATKDLVEIMPRKVAAKEIRFSDLSSIVEIVKREMERFVLLSTSTSSRRRAYRSSLRLTKRKTGKSRTAQSRRATDSASAMAMTTSVS